MAWIEQRGKRYRLVFRFAGEKHNINLKSTDRKDAEACLARLEENVRMAERGRLAIPEGADLGLFLLSDGKLIHPVEHTKGLSLGELFECYRTTFTTGVKEANTLKMERTHLKHLERILGKQTNISNVTTVQIQEYVNARAREKYGKKTINPVTTKKEVNTFKFVWGWGARQGHLKGSCPAAGVVFPKQRQKPPFRTYEQISAIIVRGTNTPAQIRELWDGLFLLPHEVNEVIELVHSRATMKWFHPMIVTTAHTGARRSELMRSHIDDLDFTNHVIHLREKKRSRDLFVAVTDLQLLIDRHFFNFS